MYKKIFIEQEETTYRIYDKGQVMNEKTGRYYKGTIRNGYRWFDLRWKNKKFAKSQHRLFRRKYEFINQSRRIVTFRTNQI